jgi:myosin heavy subunit
MGTFATFGPQEWLWVPHDEDMYVAAQVSGAGFAQGQPGSVITQDGEEIDLDERASEECLMMDSQSLSSIDDMATLNNLDEPSLLHNLRMRFRNDNIYTNVSTILVSVNPFARLPIYSPDIMNDYIARSAELPPHIFAIAGVTRMWGRHVRHILKSLHVHTSTYVC